MFKVFDKKYLDKEVEKMLLGLLKEMSEASIKKPDDFATKIRRIQEAIFKNLNHYFPDILPRECFKENGMIEFNKAKLMLAAKKKDSGGKIINDTSRVDLLGNEIENLSNTIYWVCGAIIHYEKGKTYYVGKYTLQSLTFALLEQILWYNKIVDKLKK